MTQQEKAIELLEKLIPHVYNEYDGSDGGRNFNAKRHTIQCALIVVDEIVKEYCSLNYGDYFDENLIYWQEVLHEIDKL